VSLVEIAVKQARGKLTFSKADVMAAVENSRSCGEVAMSLGCSNVRMIDA